MTDIEANSVRKPYVAPELSVYGKFADVTASGKSKNNESVGNTDKKP